MAENDLLARLLALEWPERMAWLKSLSPEEREEFRHNWQVWGRPEQQPPAGDWRVWLIMAGRGFGKTRAGSEWVRAIAAADPAARIALVAASLGEARAVMVEGESGLLAAHPPGWAPLFEPSLRRLTWANGAQATLYSAQEPESLRGPQSSHAWCDEIAKWDNVAGKAERAWDNLLLGLRLGENPRSLATTTPRAVPLVKRLRGEDRVAVVGGRTEDNAEHLPRAFLRAMRRQFGKSPGSPRKKPSSTRHWPWPTRCSTARSKARAIPRRRPRMTATAGWSG